MESKKYVQPFYLQNNLLILELAVLHNLIEVDHRYEFALTQLLQIFDGHLSDHA